MDFGMIGRVSDPRVWDYVTYVLSQFPTLGSHNLSGYAFIFDSFPNPVEIPGAGPFVAGLFGRFVLQDAEEAALLSVINPIIEHINVTWPGAMTFIQGITQYDSFLAWHQVNHDSGAAGNWSWMASRLLDKAALTRNTTALKEALKFSTRELGIITAFLVSGEGVHNAKPRGGSNSVNPAWRKAYVLSGETLPFCWLFAAALSDLFRPMLLT
jgi:hypothetical protein